MKHLRNKKFLKQRSLFPMAPESREVGTLSKQSIVWLQTTAIFSDMISKIKIYHLLLIVVIVLQGCQSLSTSNNNGENNEDPLPAWNVGTSKDQIIDFVESVSDESSNEFVPPSDRIAVLDMDGTIWCEKPFYFQFQFVVDRMRYLVGDHPEWKKDPLLNAVIEGDIETVTEYGWEGIMEVVMLTHTGMTAVEFEDLVIDWFAETVHPKTGFSYPDMVYLPMIEMIQYLKNRDFTVFVVTGSGVDFLRPWASETLGVPPHQMIGSHTKLVYQEREQDTILQRMPEILFVNDGPGKPVGIYRFIGKKPILTFGNSDADIQMFDYSQSHSLPNMQVLIHHTDSVREYAYGPQSFVGQLNVGLRLASKNNWVVVDMEKDWNEIFKRK